MVMAIGRYFSVNTGTKTILSGPFKYDPVTDPGWTPSDGGTLMLEATAISGGYTRPATPADPVDVLRQKIPAAIAANNTFRAIASPTNAQIVNYLQTVAKELNALLRLAGQLLDDTSDS